jgi:membrane associated rhomboid family serine protease
VPLERSFGSWRIGSLYVLSGIFGTMVSVVFLPEVLSVGASASVFGLVGALTALTPTPNPNPNPSPKPNPSPYPKTQPQP